MTVALHLDISRSQQLLLLVLMHWCPRAILGLGLAPRSTRSCGLAPGLAPAEADLYISPGPAKPVVDVGLSDGPGVQAYTTCNTSVAVEGRCVLGQVQAPCFEARAENWRGPAREAGMGLHRRRVCGLGC